MRSQKSKMNNKPASVLSSSLSFLAVTLIVHLLGAGCPAVAGDTIAVDNDRIVEVTVYTDRAEVTRQARVDVPAGTSFIEFGDIPIRTPADSIRVSADGIPATLGSIDLKTKVEEAVETPEFIAVREEIERIEQELSALVEADTVAQKLQSYLDKVGNVTAAKNAVDVGERTVDPNAIQGVYDLLQKNLQTLAHEGLKRQQQKKDLQEDLRLARAKLATLQPAGNIRSHVAVVEVSAGQAGSLSMKLTYNTPGAAWRPAYRATLDPETGKVNLTSEAVVRQATGEDWTGVTLRLSTAAPARGVEPPKLTPWFLRPMEHISYRSKQVDQELKGAPVAMGRAQSVYSMESDALEESMAVPSEVQSAAIVQSAYNVAFEVAGKSDVPSDNSDHRVMLRQETIPGSLIYRTVPVLNPVAYLAVKAHAPEKYPLLPGSMRVFASGAFLGSYHLKETAPNGDLLLPFGIDNRIEVERILLPQSRSREGFTGKQKQIHYAYRNLIKNQRDQKVTLVLEDRIPVSEDERIVVELGKNTTPGYEESELRPGVLLWSIELAPREEKEILFEYTVRHPRELNVPGL